MRVAIDISPTKTGHGVRGIGTYTQNLVNEFKKGKWQDINFEFFANSASPPPVDTIHYPYFDFFFHTLPILNKSGRVVVTIHDVVPLIFPDHFPRGIKGNFNFFLQKLALKNIDAVICVSKTSKNDVVKKLAFPKDKIHVVYSAPGHNFKKISNHHKLSITAKKYKLPPKFVLYVGDVNWNKNIPNLLEAVKLSGSNLVMVGKSLTDTTLAQVKEIEFKIEKLGIKNKVIRTGFVPEADLVAIYNLASATLLPSFYEGFGLSVLESMACGTPVICSNLASLAEIGKDTAIFCQPENVADIADKISKLAKLNGQAKEKLSAKLIDHVAQFTWSKTAKETLDVYKKISNEIIYGPIC